MSVPAFQREPHGPRPRPGLTFAGWLAPLRAVFRRVSIPLVGAVAATVAVSLTQAQENVAQNARIETAQQMRATVNLRDTSRESMSREAQFDSPASPGDPDLGEQAILKRPEKVQPFTLSADASGFYTSNAALTNDFKVDDFFFAAQAAVSYQPRFAPSLYGEITVRQALFRYSEFTELDFNSLNLGGGLTYVIQPLWNTALSVRYNYNRLSDSSGSDEFFCNNTVTVGLLKTFELSKAHYFYTGAASLFAWSDPREAQRNEYGIFTGYHVNLTRALAADIYFRFAYFDYTGRRADWNQTLAVALRCNVTRAFSVTGSVSLGSNDSNQNVFDYDVFTGGLGVAGSFAF